MPDVCRIAVVLVFPEKTTLIDECPYDVKDNFMIKKIAVIGATGMLGKPVTYELAKAGFTVSVLARDIAKARKLFDPTVASIIEGDLEDSGSIVRFLHGCDGVYLNLSVKQSEKEHDFHTEAEGLEHIIDAAKKCGIKRIAYISSLVVNYQGTNGFDWWAFRLKKKAIQLIKSSGIPYTIFYPSTFMDSFHHVYRKGNRILLAGTSEHKMWFVAADDYAKQVAKSFLILSNENKEYVVQGTEPFTADEAAQEYIAHYPHEKLTISKAPLGFLKFLGKFIQTINYGSNIIEALNKYPEKFEATQTWNELGKPEITLRDFAKKQALIKF
jgi:uncharacterized protein YbjT (DUF2867 family)